jgi:hypothetical protein
MITTEQRQKLAHRLGHLASPEWYLHLVGEVLPQVRGDYDKAMLMADDLYEDNPFPPDSYADKALKQLESALAVQDYAETMGIHPGEV